MTTQIIVVLVTFMLLQAVRALYMSLKKERVMVREGGSPLPTSAWVFLLIEVATAPLFLWGYLVIVTPIVALIPASTLWLAVVTGLGYFISVFISRVISTLVATITRVILIKKHEKALKGNTEQEVAEALRKQLFND